MIGTFSQTPRLHLPQIVQNKFRNLKRRNLPRDHGLVRTLTHANIIRRRVDKEKKWPLRGWDTDNIADDGIVGWMKTQSILESKQGSNKRPTALNLEHYVPIKSKCSAIENVEEFTKQSLHKVFLPKEPKSSGKNLDTGSKTTVILRITNASNTVGVITPVGFEKRFETQPENNDPAKHNMDSYRQAKNDGTLPERRSRSVPESHPQNVSDKENQRSTTYHNIKRLLKFSTKDRRYRRLDGEDEGYSSKTSSAETKPSHGPESDSEEDSDGVKPDKNKMYSSMINLSELPSNALSSENTEGIDNPRVKFSYTHQPAILQLPDPDVKLVHDSVRLEKRIESEETGWSYSKLKRSKELNRRCPLETEATLVREESTMYNIDTLKPVTYVLRKISIQNAEETSLIPPSNWNSQIKENLNGTLSHKNSRTGSKGESRAGSAISRGGSALSRADSAVSRSSSSMSQNNSHHRLRNKPVSNHTINNNNNTRELYSGTNVNSREPMWSQEYSVTERQATSYCIGDLLPAVDKNLYTNPYAKAKLGPHPNTMNHDNEISDWSNSSHAHVEDGYMLLKKGMDLLTSGIEKPTLGPPGFRPNLTRNPLIRSVTVVVDNKQHEYYNRASPVHGRLKGKSSPVRVSSDKGPRPKQTNPDKETQKKLKEAFTKFYQNRPKEIGKEFRRMQTMWNS